MFKNRYRIIIIVFIAWSVFITFRLFQYTVYSREHFLEEGNRHAWRCGTIPAARGKILDKNGLTLAWTQRYHDLYVELYPDLCRPNSSLMNELRQKIKGLALDERNERYVRKGLSPAEISSLKEYMPKYQGIRIVPRFERLYVDYPEVRKFLGAVDSNDGKFFGTKGAELKYDRQLNGTDGVYVVMLDRNRNWIPGTWKLRTEMVAGNDMMLEYSLEDIISMSKKKSDAGKPL